MPKSNRAALPGVLAAFVSFSSAADGPGARDAEAIENLVVTAARVAIPAGQVGSSITVISRDELELRQPTFVSDALRDVPGVAVSRGGGFGAVTQVRIRGTEGNHALVLIDGVEANNPVANSEFDFANLLVADIERIEILRGPQSALYGSDAVGGVINIITRERSAGFDASLSAETGTFGTRAVGLSVGGGGERYTGGVSWTRLETRGQNIAREGDEVDGFDNEALSLKGRALLGDAIAVNANLRYIDSRQDFDSQDFSFPPGPTQGLVVDDDVSSNIEQWFSRIEATIEQGRLAHRLGVSGTRTRNTFFDAGAVSGRNAGDKNRLDYQLTFALGSSATADAADAADAALAGSGGFAAAGLDHAVTVALERELVDYANYGATPDALENQTQSDEQSSVVAEYRVSRGRAGFSASARRDRNRLFDDASTYRLTGTLDIGDTARLHTSLGTGISNPGFFDLFGFFPGSFIGNPALKPERSTSFDVGIERFFGGGNTRLDVTYFRADLDEEIVTSFDSATFLSTVDNLAGRSDRRGVELSLSAAPTSRWQMSASYTYTDAEQPDGAPELRRPRHVASLDNTFSFVDGRARLNVGVDHSGTQFDSELIFATPEERVALPGFTLVNVSGDFRIDSRWRVYGRVENLLDEDYEEWFSYRGRSRAFVAGFAVALAP
jgi:vitamin B12 transporter